MSWSKGNLPEAVKNKNWSEHQIEVFIAAANHFFFEYGDNNKAIENGMTAAEKSSEKRNASQFPSVYYCRHMQPGVARYENETILVDTEGMKNLLKSVGTRSVPVYVNHQNVDLKNIKQQADGYVTDSFYNEMDGWGWFKFIAVDDKAHSAIKNGYSVSNAYVPNEFGPKGTKNNIPFDREVRNGEFTHLAIVPDPRYEGAKIFTPDEFKIYQDDQRQRHERQNSKEKPMFKFFNKVETDKPTAESLIEVNGKTVSMEQIINALEKKKEPNEEETVTVNGKTMTKDAAIEAYVELQNAKKKKGKKNEKMKNDPETDDVDSEGDEKDEGDDEIGEGKKNRKKKEKKNEKEEDDCMSNEADEGEDDEYEEEGDAKKNKKKAEKKNSLTTIDLVKKPDYFNELRNANIQRAEAQVRTVTAGIDQVARGKERYGSGK